MIEELTDLEIINYFLSKFNYSAVTLKDPFKKYICYKLSGKAVSFLNYSLIYERMEIEYIYTDPFFRNMGLDSILLNYLVELGKKNHCQNITLEVKISNEQAIRFYEKHGFHKASIRKKYYNGEDGILMIRELI